MPKTAGIMKPATLLWIGAAMSAAAFVASWATDPPTLTGTWCAGDSACIYDGGFRRVAAHLNARDIAPDINFAVVVVA